MLVMGVPFVRAYRTEDGRYVNYEFENSEDRAWLLARAWIEESEATVNGPALMRAYKEMSKALFEARTNGEYRDERLSKFAA